MPRIFRLIIAGLLGIIAMLFADAAVGNHLKNLPGWKWIVYCTAIQETGYYLFSAFEEPRSTKKMIITAIICGIIIVLFNLVLVTLVVSVWKFAVFNTIMMMIGYFTIKALHEQSKN